MGGQLVSHEYNQICPVFLLMFSYFTRHTLLYSNMFVVSSLIRKECHIFHVSINHVCAILLFINIKA